MVDIYVYFTRLPSKINEMISVDCDGNYTIYIDEGLDEYQKLKSYRHALKHIKANDHYAHGTVSNIENKAHEKGGAT